MHTARLLQLASFLEQLEPTRFTLRTWVNIPGNVEIKSTLRTLPEGSKACPIGWLPCVDPENWCWIQLSCPQHGGVYPVYKQAKAWQEIQPQPQGGDLHPVITRLWQQAREWFEVESLPPAVRMFELAGYDGREPSPAQVAERIREVAGVQ
jgi:hypothetical protein